MSEPRPAASLTSNLLARRGDARPAMRRQAITNLHAPIEAHDDLGWNDIGEEHQALPPSTPLGLTPPDRVGAYDEDRGDFEGEDAIIEIQHVENGGSPLARHLEMIAQRITSIATDTSSKAMSIRLPTSVTPRKSAGLSVADRKAAFTLRLDAERHLRLRLLSALTNRSSQQLLIEALDLLLARHEKVENLAGQVEEASVGYEEDNRAANARA